MKKRRFVNDAAEQFRQLTRMAIEFEFRPPNICSDRAQFVRLKKKVYSVIPEDFNV